MEGNESLFEVNKKIIPVKALLTDTVKFYVKLKEVMVRVRVRVRQPKLCHNQLWLIFRRLGKEK